jgi:hypothetical protein
MIKDIKPICFKEFKTINQGKLYFNENYPKGTNVELLISALKISGAPINIKFKENTAAGYKAFYYYYSGLFKLIQFEITIHVDKENNIETIDFNRHIFNK